ncbi:uncharacterized protein LOC135093332 isoform X3 [Scylla paramamosain]|uniref:uncharacterized protein LOC135093332 isoform X3 n=1 Tax=Scylla paramamosain TaxID=85552 RepID=UPI003083CF6F
MIWCCGCRTSQQSGNTLTENTTRGCIWKWRVPTENRKSLLVGALVFLDPKSIPAGVVYGTDSREQVHSHKLTGPVVEIEVSTNDDLSFVTEGISLNMSYYDPDVTTERNVCGGAEVSGTLGETLKWDLTRCSVLNLGHRGRRVTRCHCQGPGVFAFIKMPENLNSKQDKVHMS